MKDKEIGILLGGVSAERDISLKTGEAIDPADNSTVLEKFEGIDRRFQSLGEVATAAGKVTLIDDYGHHPTEIAATLAAARSGWPDKRVVLVFQPHRYTRTRDLLDDFASVLSEADVLVVLEVFAAGEDPIAGADGRAIARAVRSRAGVEPVFVESLDDLAVVLEDLLAAAVNDAVRKVEAHNQKAMSGLTSGLNLPGGFKMPF